METAMFVSSSILSLLLSILDCSNPYKGTRCTNNNLQWWWVGQTSYVWVCAVAKISITLALLRLTVSRVHKMILWTVIAVTTLVGLVFWFILTLQCQPVSYFWQRARLYSNPLADVNGECLNLNVIIDVAYVYSVTATCCDLTLGLLPVFLVWNLQMNSRTKAALAGILGMGCMYVEMDRFKCLCLELTGDKSSASAAVIVRIPYLHDYKDDDFLCE